jgi:hypothetical protein
VGDIDRYRIPVASPGQRISIRLTNLDADADLVLHQPVDPSAAPLHRISTDSQPIGDEGYDSAAERRELAPETLQDVPVQVAPLHRISATRGDADETIEAVATNADVAGGGYVIQVSGHNGAASDTPYVLRVRITAPRAAPECTNTFEHAPGPVGSTWAAPSSSSTDTLVLFNERRLRRLHGTTEVGRGRRCPGTAGQHERLPRCRRRGRRDRPVRRGRRAGRPARRHDDDR